MLKSPEEYLSSLSFDPPDTRGSALDASEKAFVEKYLGLDIIGDFPVIDPEPVLLPQAPAPEPLPLQLKEPEIIVAKEQGEPVEKPLPVITVAPARSTEQMDAAPDIPLITETLATEDSLQKAEIEILHEDASPVLQQEDTAVSPESIVQDIPAEIEPVAPSQAAARLDNPAEPLEKALEPAAEADLEQTIRGKLRTAEHVQTVSFFVAEQLFLLPVAGIQEVVRHMDLVKVPQAPSFIAGAINLRGKVLPLVYLSELLTNTGLRNYSEKSFVIITGQEAMQIGLIVDRVNSMHLIPQQKFIWNAESKIGDAAEFLSAIVDLDDKVCGLVSVESIKQKILSAF